MVRKFGRHAPCPCGSGSKFYQCCGSRELPEFQDAKVEELTKDPRFTAIIDRANGIRKNIPLTPSLCFVDTNNAYRLVGNHLYRRPRKETFHEFLVHLLKWTLGKQWHEEQLKLKFEARHQIFRWLTAATEFSKSLIDNPRFRDGSHYGDLPSGDVYALTTTAYDVFHLLNIGSIPDELLSRLRIKSEFQGAKYEITIAAILVRAGCIPTFIREKSSRHCDINSYDPITGTRFLIEAKSRHRPGTLGFHGQKNAGTAMRRDIENLIDDALKQNPGNAPFMIFADLNSPPLPKEPVRMRLWYKEMQTLMSSLGEPKKNRPDEFNTIVLTNFSYHWQEQEKALAGDYLWIHSGEPKHFLPTEVTARVLNAVQTYGEIPREVSRVIMVK